ncbi:site-specific integrase [Rufibacter hautae]|uniref:Site-specific integrase n=1 Tax=Rufibacter hautae TaxID=2595005 RepID=A0A5B6TIR2_9BACT|nr:site-specific integrase [Rufibacter hautae]KAA3439906.1 site-specific integrase [Rufibacter hautae]
MTLNYYLDKPKAEGDTAIYLFLRTGKQTIKIKTGQYINPKYWNTKPDKNGNHVKRNFTGCVEFNAWLDNRRSEMLKLYNRLTADGNVSFEELREAVLSHHEEKEPERVVGLLEHLLGFIAVRSTELSKATLAKYKILHNHLDGFSRHLRFKLSFEAIDMRFFDLFRAYLIQEKKHTDNTLWKDFATLKTFMAWANDRGLHQNLTFRKFKVAQREAEMVYLTEEELMRLYNAELPLGSKLDRVRDCFCFGCFTGQRYSDIAKLRRSDVKGNRWLLRDDKTDKAHHIVPLNGFALAILEKYEGDTKPLPVISNQKSNEYIKDLCEMVGIDEPTTVTRKLGSDKLANSKRTVEDKVVTVVEREALPKYEFIGTHTARRTFITLSLEKGMRPEVVMRISGHTNYATFKKYIKISEKVTENEMNDIWRLPAQMKVVS